MNKHKIEQPTFSVVTVVYNGESILEETITSCINQDYSQKEYIVVNGASTDHTTDIIQKHRDHITCIIDEPDHGIYDAMNKAISIATGKWIIFMNAGDFFYSTNVLTLIADMIEKFPETDVMYGNTLYHYQNRYLLAKPLPLQRICREMIACHQSIFIRTELVKQHPFDTKLQLAADYKMLFMFYSMGFKFKYIDQLIAVFNQDGGKTLQNFIRTTKERYSVHRDHGTFKNRLLMYAYIVSRNLAHFVKSKIPQKLLIKLLEIKNNKKIYRPYSTK